MAGNNPIFQRIEKDMRSGYAGFGARAASAGPAGPRHADVPAAARRPLHLPERHARSRSGRVTFDDVIMKALGLFTLVVAVAAGTWVYTRSIAPALTMPAMWGGMIGTLVLGFVIAFKKTISVPLILTYAVLEGTLRRGHL